jgi:malate synthase
MRNRAERASRPVQAQDLLAVPKGDITDEGLRWNIDVGLQYLHSWLQGSGCVPIYNLMEDAATAEICRAQVWQWVQARRALQRWQAGDGRHGQGDHPSAGERSWAQSWATTKSCGRRPRSSKS